MTYSPQRIDPETIRIPATPVHGISPVDGWSLLTFDEQDSDRFWTTAYVARGPHRDFVLDVSRFAFRPTQDRFAWLVRNGFPPRPTLFGGWSDIQIEARIALEPEMAA